MSFLTLNGTTVHVRSNALQQKDNEHRLDRERMFDGTMRMTRGGVFRQWDVTTHLMTEADANTLLALIRSGNVLTASGDVVGADTPVMPVPGGNNPVHIGGGQFRRQVTFTLHETGGPLPPDRTAIPWAFYQRGTGYWQDTDGSKTTPALDGDPVYTWEDKSGNGRDGVADHSGFTTDDSRPTRDNDELHFGVGPGYPGAGSGRTLIVIPSMLLLNEAEFMVSLRGALDPPATSDRAGAFDFTPGGESGTRYPDTDGHVKIDFGFTQLDVGDLVADLTSRHVVNVSASNVTGLLTIRFDNVELLNHTLVGSESYTWDMTSPYPNIGMSTASGWDGWARDVLIVNTVMTESQRRSWFDYFRGATTEPPLPI